MAAENLSTLCTEQNTLVLLTHEKASKWIFTEIEKTTYLTAFMVIVIFGLTGNFSFIYTVAKVPKLSTNVNLYLVNLAVADILFLILNAVYYIGILFHSSVKENIPYNRPASCFLIFGIATLCYYTSIGTIILVSIERFIAVCHPVRHRYLQNKKLSAKLLLIVWIVSFGPMAFTTLRYSNHTTFCVRWPDDKMYETMPETINICVFLDGLATPAFTTASSLVFLASFFVPMTAIAIMNCKIVITLKHRDRLSSSSSFYFNNIRRQVTRTLLILVTIFFVFQLPLRSMSALYIIREIIGKDFFNKDIELIILVIGRILVLVNSATNSLVYISVSSHYRQSFKEAFGFSPSE